MTSVRVFVVGLCAALSVGAKGWAQSSPAQPSAVTAPTQSSELTNERRMEPIGAVATPAGAHSFSMRVGAHRLWITPGLDVIGQYSLRLTESATGLDWFHRFDLNRAHVALGFEWNIVRARIVLEAVRSASEGALIGVAGDSLLFRVREGYAAVRPWPWLEAQMGVVATLTIPTIEGAWAGRAVGASSLEATGLSSPADLGITVRAALPRSLGTLAIGAYNGEGYALRELNRGKNIELFADVRPFATLGLSELGLFASYVLGSSGTGRARADRLTVGLQFDRARYGAGVSSTVAWGVADASDRTSVLLEAFARAEPVVRWLLNARFTFWNRDLSRPDDQLWTMLFGTGVRIADPVSAWLSLSRTSAGAATAASIPGVEAWEARVSSRAVF